MQEKLKEQAKMAKERAEAQEQMISELKQDCYNMQEEVQKALKIHRANKELSSKNSLLKKEMERLQHEHKAELQTQINLVETLNQ